jgi:hypothetical protein
MVSEQFEEKLAIGTAGEDIVYPWLKSRNSLVQDMRYQKHEKGSGPRLEGTEGKIVLPDFAVWNKNPNKGNFLVDVKVKKDIYPVKGKRCFTVDKKFEDYRRCSEIMKMDFLQIIFIYEDKFYVYKHTDLTCTTVYNNQYSTGLVYCFEYDKSKIEY